MSVHYIKDIGDFIKKHSENKESAIRVMEDFIAAITFGDTFCRESPKNEFLAKVLDRGSRIMFIANVLTEIKYLPKKERKHIKKCMEIFLHHCLADLDKILHESKESKKMFFEWVDQSKFDAAIERSAELNRNTGQENTGTIH